MELREWRRQDDEIVAQWAKDGQFGSMIHGGEERGVWLGDELVAYIGVMSPAGDSRGLGQLMVAPEIYGTSLVPRITKAGLDCLRSLDAKIETLMIFLNENNEACLRIAASSGFSRLPMVAMTATMRR